MKKKSTILYVLKLLQEGSSQKKPISQLVITRTLNLLNIECDRKTIARDIDCLIDFGYKIVKNKGGGCYYVNDKVDKNEVEDIISSIQVSKLSSARKSTLIKRVKEISYFNTLL